MRRLIFVMLLCSAGVFGVQKAAYSQCAMCSEALKTASDHDSSGDLSKNELRGLPLGIFKSILVMLGSFFALAGSVIFLIVREGRKSDAEVLRLAEAEMPPNAAHGLPGHTR